MLRALLATVALAALVGVLAAVFGLSNAQTQLVTLTLMLLAPVGLCAVVAGRRRG